jgi:hypothetical protein
VSFVPLWLKSFQVGVPSLERLLIDLQPIGQDVEDRVQRETDGVFEDCGADHDVGGRHGNMDYLVGR